VHALKEGKVRSDLVEFDICGPKPANQGFKPMIREGAFDAGELAIGSFLQAKVYGKPLVLLPAVVMARSPHGYLCYNTERGPLSPADLNGKTVGKRSYSVTTSTWIREILYQEYRVDQDRVSWVTFETPHVAEFRDPPNVRRAPEGATMESMLLSGELDAAILAELP
jgi:4,5-dihydroxyphthalate decarboxylase